MEDLDLQKEWEQQERIFSLQTGLLNFVTNVLRVPTWKLYWEEIAEIETGAQAKAFLTKYGFWEKYKEYRLNQKEQTK